MKKLVLGCLILLSCLLLSPATVKADDFEISDTTLVKYNGTDSFVVIPDGVTVIGVNAFAKNTTMTEVSIPDSVTIIDAGAFEYCMRLKQVYFPRSLVEIRSLAFRGCESLETIDLPEGLGSIYDNSFRECRALKEVTVPASVLFVEYGAFSHCESLKTIKVREGNAKFKSIDGVLYSADEKTIVQYPAGKEDPVAVIREGTREIGRNAFAGCALIEGVTIPTSVTSVRSYSFSYCTALKEVVLPQSVTTVSNHVFTGDTALEKVTICNPAATISEEAFEWNTAVCAPAGSEAEKYAEKNGLTFEELPAASVTDTESEDDSTGSQESDAAGETGSGESDAPVSPSASSDEEDSSEPVPVSEMDGDDTAGSELSAENEVISKDSTVFNIAFFVLLLMAVCSLAGIAVILGHLKKDYDKLKKH